MSQQRNQLDAGGVEPEAGRCVAILILYEDLAAGLQAKQTCDRVGRHLSRRFTVRCIPWRFDLLQDPQWQEAATGEAVDADLLLVAAHGHTELPAAVKAWVEQWVSRPDAGQRALVACLDPRDSAASAGPSINVYLRRTAYQGCVDFFCACPGCAQEEETFSWEKIGERAGQTSVLLDQILRRRYPPPAWKVPSGGAMPEPKESGAAGQPV